MREMHIHKCQFGHQLTATDLGRYPLEMNKMSEILQEQPDPRSIAWKVFILPETKEAFERKFAGRIHITLATLVAALCDDRLIFIEGDDAAKLRAKGLVNGAQILAALEGVAQLEREKQEILGRLNLLLQSLRDAGVTE
jgi:hypothetical protein